MKIYSSAHVSAITVLLASVRRQQLSAAAMSTASSSIPAGFPVAVKSVAVDIDGLATDIIINTYLDAIVLIASQLGTMGTIIQAK